MMRLIGINHCRPCCFKLKGIAGYLKVYSRFWTSPWVFGTLPLFKAIEFALISRLQWETVSGLHGSTREAVLCGNLATVWVVKEKLLVVITNMCLFLFELASTAESQQMQKQHQQTNPYPFTNTAWEFYQSFLNVFSQNMTTLITNPLHGNVRNCVLLQGEL